MELIILECFAALFLFLSIIRPLIRGLWKLPGLTVCPLLALGIIIGIFPAYGFRPECIPLLLFAFFLVIANSSDFFALFFNLHSDSFRDKGLLFTLGSATAFVFTLWVTIHFAPPIDVELGSERVRTIFLNNEGLHLRVYSPVEYAEQSPLLILLPPAAGSFIVCDEVCSALRDRGFTVLAYSRLNFDSPSFDQNGQPIRLNVSGLYRLGNAISRGLSHTKANAGGRELEEVRKQDIVFLLRELSENNTLIQLPGNTDKNMIFLAGYGAGGAALTILAAQESFSAAFPQVQGIVAIEAPLLSSLKGDPPPEPPPAAPDPITALFRQLGILIRRMSPEKITHISGTPRPVLPVLFIISDRVINDRNGRYATILQTLASSRNAALLAAVHGAGPFDYSASPTYYPLYSFLFRGAGQTGQNYNWPELTAALITNFAILALENSAALRQDRQEFSAETGDPEFPAENIQPKISLTKTALGNAVYLEQGGIWHITNVQTILQ